MNFFDKLKSICKTVLEDEPMSRHTSFRIGGAADFMVFPESIEEMQQIFRLCKEENVPITVLGNGSNVLVSDDGIEGVVISVSDKLSDIEICGENIFAQAGVMLATLSNAAAKASLSGLEFASGIPGTLGGAIVMNAGAYGGEMKDVIETVGVMDSDGNVLEIAGKDAKFGYRTSVFSDYLVLYAKMRLEKGNQAEIKEKMAELNAKRREKQPLNFPSAGSTFKRPQGYFAGKLIEDAGLKGYRVGGAAVSEKHSGFVVNTGGATAKDVKTLIDDVRKKVKHNFGVELEREVKYIGRE